MTDAILQILKDIRPESDFSASANFLEDGLLDSFDMIVLVSTLEKKFAVAIDGADIVPENFKSLGDIQKLLCRCGGKP